MVLFNVIGDEYFSIIYCFGKSDPRVTGTRETCAEQTNANPLYKELGVSVVKQRTLFDVST
jgi:hypothetical protein